MTLEEIKNAVESGKTVHWASSAYIVMKDKLDQWFIKCVHNNNYIGLTWQDGVTMNGSEDQFFISES